MIFLFLCYGLALYGVMAVIVAFHLMMDMRMLRLDLD